MTIEQRVERLENKMDDLVGGLIHVAINDDDPPSKRVTFKDGCIIGLTDADMMKFVQAYPAVDIHSSIHRAEVWLLANPSKQKKNYYRFITNWLSRNQERGGDRTRVEQPKPTEVQQHGVPQKR
jgi:hypothetical protein